MRSRHRVSARQVALGLTACAAGLLLVVSGVAASGIDLRAGETRTLTDLTASNASHARQVSAARLLVGVAPVSGRGVTVTLTDAPASRMHQAGVDPSELLVHQQDIQAVVNAMWAAHAAGVTVQGQRVLSTTGITCVGNTVVIRGIPYSPPYVITAVGSPAAIFAGLDHDQRIGYYLAMVPKGLGWRVTERAHVTLPPYRGSTDLVHARPFTVGPVHP